MFLSIITATYNRGYCLGNIYNSLLTNNKELFEWIIVDDGSVDSTKMLISSWIRENKIRIVYVKQVNGGKTRAIINGFKQNPNGEFSVILDSDDYLVDGIINKLYIESKSLLENEIGMIGHKCDTKNNLIGSKFHFKSGNYIDLYFGKNKVFGDKLFVIKTKFYSTSFITPYIDENFIPDNIPYIKTNSNGLLKCLNYFLYKGDYLQDGMTANVLKMAANNLKGFILEKKMLQNENLPFIEKIKNEIKYISYSYAGSFTSKDIVKNSNNKLLTTLLLQPAKILTSERINKIKQLRKG